ncbi:ribokinase [Virgibacillus subterraneus]|uniref:Ribokinase n=1 Tax=Virgibacillus subterraneus TaxID=621109 RepID=A0A1H9FIG2_9BACI|nr:ribokinase [Virgibacillus subterraneus]SEQ37731.1 ribokinase [Virgibacillus subterraneus]
MAIKPSVCVVGSINMDLIVTTRAMPKQGETVLGDDFFTYPGGKGANQAVAAARIGSNVNFIGAVGDDPFGKTLLEHLESESINIDGVATVSSAATGIANIILSENDNRIIVASGANLLVTPELVEHNLDQIKHSDVVLLQLEVPMETVLYTLKAASTYNIPVIVNPAPYQPLPDGLLEKASYLTPNELEVESIKNDPLFEGIHEKVIVTQGDQGVQFFEGGVKKHVPSYPVDVEDTTGAGDTFNGVFATELARGSAVGEAIQLANAASALSVTKVGAQGGMPTKEEVEKFLLERKVSE